LNTANPNPGGSKPQRVAVIGGGVTGLAAAHRLLEIHPQAQVVLYEASDRLGGVLKTEQRDGYLIEHAADMFITEPPWALDLCRRVGLAEELIGTNDQYRQAFVVCRGRLEPVPEGFMLLQPSRARPVLKTPLLSWRGKLRLGMEYFVPRRRADVAPASTSREETAMPHKERSDVIDIADESLASFARRRLGREAYERLVQPLVSGIYTADPERLSLAATLPRFLEMEQEYRSLIRAAWEQRKARPRMKAASPRKEESGIRYGIFMAPRRGMASLVDALAARLTAADVRLRTTVARIERSPDGRWHVVSGAAANPESFDALIVAALAPAAAELLSDVDRELCTELRQIEYAGSAVVCIAYPRSQIEHRLDGFGFVVPAIERRQIIAASFASVKFAGRAPADRVLFRVFVGGALQPELLRRSDDQLQRMVCEELADLLDARGKPDFVTIARWTGVMPQYHVGHLDRVARIEDRVAKLHGLQLAGNAYHGVGIPHCIHSGERAAEELLRA
jgi:oxygen-dependent protoporphyrinogen oxidase